MNNKIGINITNEILDDFIYNYQNDNMRTMLEIVVSLHDEGWKIITLVVGSDRVGAFDKMLNTYNGVEGKAHGYYNFDYIN